MAREKEIDVGEARQVGLAGARKGGKTVQGERQGAVVEKKGQLRGGRPAQRVANALQKLQHMDADIRRSFEHTRQQIKK